MVVLTSVAEEFLDGADIVTIVEQVGGEGVAEGVGGGEPGDPGGSAGGAGCALDNSLVHVVPAALPGRRVQVRGGGGEQPLPGPLAGGGRILAGDGVRQVDKTLAEPPAAASRELT